MLGRLQILRFAAAYMVVVFHTLSFLASDAGLDAPGRHVGAAGVDLFFVISGFIMMYVSGPNAAPGRFMLNRIARIVPLYWLATFAAVAVIVAIPWYLWNGEFSAQRLIASLAFVPSAHSSGNFDPILFVGWTLNWEMAFYVLFALSLFAPRARRLTTLVALVIALFAIGRLTPDADSPLRFYGATIIFEFIFGCLIAWAVRTPRVSTFLNRLPPWPVLVTGALFLAGTGAISVSDDMRAILWGLPAALIVLGVVLLDLNRPPVASRVFVALGDSSYSAYLLHPFLIPGLGVIWSRTLEPSWPTALILIGVCLVATAAVSHLSYRLVETPGRGLLRNLFGLSPRRYARNADEVMRPHR